MQLHATAKNNIAGLVEELSLLRKRAEQLEETEKKLRQKKENNPEGEAERVRQLCDTIESIAAL